MGSGTAAGQTRKQLSFLTKEQHFHLTSQVLPGQGWAQGPFSKKQQPFSKTTWAVTGLGTDLWPTAEQAESPERLLRLLEELVRPGAASTALQQPGSRASQGQAGPGGRSPTVPTPGGCSTETRQMEASISNNHYNPDWQSLNYITVSRANS